MDLLGLFLAASVIGAGLVAWVIIWTTNRASESAITRHFKASERILETGQPPPGWLNGGWRQRLPGASATANGEERALKRLDELIRFFENCSFYEDDFAREQHLSQLERLREAWQAGEIQQTPPSS